MYTCYLAFLFFEHYLPPLLLLLLQKFLPLPLLFHLLLLETLLFKLLLPQELLLLLLPLQQLLPPSLLQLLLPEQLLLFADLLLPPDLCLPLKFWRKGKVGMTDHNDHIHMHKMKTHVCKVP